MFDKNNLNDIYLNMILRVLKPCFNSKQKKYCFSVGSKPC